MRQAMPTIYNGSRNTPAIQPLPLSHVSLGSTPAIPFPTIPPIFDVPSLADDTIDTPFLNNWADYLHAQQTQTDIRHVTLHASDVRQVASGLWLAIMALANNMDLSDQELGCDIENFTTEAIMNGKPQVYMFVSSFQSCLITLTLLFRGDSVGVGVMQAIWSTMWTNVLSLNGQERFWTNDDQQFYQLSLQTQVLAAHITTSDEAYLRGCGLGIRISVIWDLMTPLSPSLVLYLASGSVEGAMSSDFLLAVQPTLEARLQTWPPPSKTTSDGRTILDLDVRKDPWTLIASCVSFEGTQVCLCFLL